MAVSLRGNRNILPRRGNPARINTSHMDRATPMHSRKLNRLAPALVSLALLVPPLVRANDLETAQKQWLAGQRVQAITTIERALVQTPDDSRLRFALGVMRLEMGQPAEARAIFTELTQDFPDLADPYNNLAVLDASQGRLDEARASLEQALRLQPDHAQALENFGDVLLRLALRSYQRAQGALPAPSQGLALKLRRVQAVLEAAARQAP